MIRTSILCVPNDEQAIDQLRLLLRSMLPGVFIVEEKSAESQRNWIEEILRAWADEEDIDLILTIGGTYPAPGPSNEQIVPEATLSIIERQLPGLSEAMRAVAHEQTELALLDRGVAGIRSRSLIINLPAGAAPAYLFLESIISVIPAILAYLQSTKSLPEIADELEIVAKVEPESLGFSDEKAESSPDIKGLDPAEFAEFLRRKER